MKNLFKSALLLCAFYSVNAFATAVVNLPPPYPQNAIGAGSYQLNLAAANNSSTALASGAFVDLSDGYRILNMNAVDSTGDVLLDVQSTAAFSIPSGNQLVVTLSVTSTSGSEIPLEGAAQSDQQSGTIPAACNSSGSITCLERNGDSRFVSALYTPGSIIRLAFNTADLCATTGVGTSICPSQGSIGTLSGNTITQAITATFSYVPPATSASPYPIGAVSGGADTLSFTLGLTDVPPTIAAPTSPAAIELFYHPADGAILINSGNYITGTGTNGVAVQSLVVLADQSSTPVISSNARPEGSGIISALINSQGNNLPVTGFTNTTNGTDNGYNAAIYAVNSAGIFSATSNANSSFASSSVVTPFGDPGLRGTAANSVSADGLVRSEGVNSVLSNSKCFIATAAFHDGDAPPVLMLRKFRDHVLKKFSWGRKFIQEYYTYSPPLAVWAWDKPIIRSLALHALAPVEFIAWAILKITHAEQVDSPQPYIDRIKKELDAEDNQKNEVNESYSESIKKKLPTEKTDSYSERLKKELGPDDDKSTGYSDKLKKEIPPDDYTGDPIKDFKNGKSEAYKPKKPPITAGVSFQFGVDPGVQVKNTNSPVNFYDMYGNGNSNGWQPDLIIRYENQLFHSENFGSFGITGSIGFSYAEGYGIYQFPFGSTNSLQSQNKFSFLQIPLTVGGVYRFNLFRLFRPYAGVDIGSMQFIEIGTGSYSTGTKVAHTLIYEGRLGISLLLDSADSVTTRDGFLADGIQHTYLYAEYLAMSSFNTSGLIAKRNGGYLGFLFEY